MLADENEQNVLRGKGISQKQQQQKLRKRSERRKNEIARKFIQACLM